MITTYPPPHNFKSGSKIVGYLSHSNADDHHISAHTLFLLRQLNIDGPKSFGYLPGPEATGFDSLSGHIVCLVAQWQSAGILIRFSDPCPSSFQKGLPF